MTLIPGLPYGITGGRAESTRVNGLASARVLGTAAGGRPQPAFLSQALHHAVHPERAIAEAWRILKRGGRIAILDLSRHHFEEAREMYADLWLGFTELEIERTPEGGGLQARRDGGGIPRAGSSLLRDHAGYWGEVGQAGAPSGSACPGPWAPNALP
jgi:hypothetical protein